MNHSYNVVALGIDGYYRTCFVSLLFNDSLRHFVTTSNKMIAKAKRNDLYKWAYELNENKYICLATGAIADKKIRHPTHHEYLEVRDGNPPMNLKPIKQLPLNIQLIKGTSLPKSSQPQSNNQGQLVSRERKLTMDRRTEAIYLGISESLECNPDIIRLERIHEYWAKGERRLKVIVPAVWADVPGVSIVDSRAYKKARAEYRRLTGG